MEGSWRNGDGLMKPIEITERLIDMIEEGVSSHTIALKMSIWYDYSLREAEKQLEAFRYLLSKNGKEDMLSRHKPEETEKTIPAPAIDTPQPPPPLPWAGDGNEVQDDSSDNRHFSTLFMRRWEYVSYYDLLDLRLNELGMEGWELVSVRVSDGNSIFVFKRPLN